MSGTTSNGLLFIISSTFLNYSIFKLSRLSLPRSRTLPTTGGRLGAAAAFTKRSAGNFRSCSHGTFCGVTAAVAPNRSLCVVFLFHCFNNSTIFGYPLSFAISIAVLPFLFLIVLSAPFSNKRVTIS